MSIKYIKPVYTKNQKGDNLMGDRHSDGFGDNADPWGTKRDASMYRTNDTYDGLYETFEDRMTQELINIEAVKGDSITAESLNSAPVSVILYPKAASGWLKSGVKLLRGYTTLFVGNEKNPVAIESKFGTKDGYFIKSGDFDSLIDSVTFVKVDEAGKEEDGEPNAVKVTFKQGTGNGKKLNALGIKNTTDLKGFARFDLEADFEGDELGEIELVMSDYEFRPRPTSIGVTWSQLAEITLDASFGLSAQDMLVTYAADAIRVNLDYRAFKFAYAQAKTNGHAVVEFDAGYNSSTADNAGTKEGYIHNAQTFTTALDTVSDNMLNEIDLYTFKMSLAA